MEKMKTSRTHLDPFQPEERPLTLMAGDSYQGQPYLHLDTSSAELCAGRDGRPNAGLVLDERYGVALAGPISLFAQPDQISIAGGYWRLNPLLLATAGSSAALNVPVLVRAKPEAMSIQKDLGFIGKMAGIGGFFR